MSRRVLLTSALIALLLGTIFLAPGFPPVRDALLNRALRFAEDAGVSVTYDRAGGNAWRRVELLGVTVAGHGADVRIDRLEVAYHLPSLLGGELPLSVSARGVSGDVDLSDLETLVEDAVTDGGGGGGLPVRVVLREVDLEDVVLSSANAPFAVPDATLSELRVEPEQGALLLGARVTTEHGSVTAEGRLTVPTFDLTGTITEGDVSVAQYWWEGATSGTVSGPFSWRKGQLNADLRIDDGRIDQSGIVVTGISGTAMMRYPVVTASLTGGGLGGPVTAEGTVNIAGLNYRATGTAAPQLAEVASWLSEFAGLDGVPVDGSGRANVTATVDGWQAPTILANASAQGALAGLPLEELTGTLNLTVGGAMRATLDALLAGGEVEASLGPSAMGSRLELVGTNLDLTGLEVMGFAPGGAVPELRGQIELAGSPSGTLAARWIGALAGYSGTVDVDGRLDADGLQAFFAAEAVPQDQTTAVEPITATGAVVLANQTLEAGASIADLHVPGLQRPLRLGLNAQGPLTDLLLTATVENDNPVLLDVAWLQPGGALAASDPVDVRGSATGRLTDGAVTGIVGRFGPVGVGGQIDLAPLQARLDFDVAPLTVRVGATTPTVGSAPVAATLAATSGELVFADGALTVAARSTVENARAGTVSVGLNTVDTRFELRPGGIELADMTTWSLEASATDGAAHFAYDSSGAPYSVALNDLPVHVTATGRPALLSGSLTPAPGGVLNLVAELAPGSNIAGLTLTNGATFEGELSAPLQRLDLAGAVGALPTTGTVDWSQPLVTVDAVIEDPNQPDSALTVRYVPSSGAWALAGSSALAPLLNELGLSGVQATYAGQLAFTEAAGYEGEGNVRLTAPVPVGLQLTGQGEQLTLRLSGDVGGVPLEGEGVITEPLVPALVRAFSTDSTGAPGLLVDLGPLENVTVDVEGVRGAGEIPAQNLGPATLGPVPWSLQFDWTDTAGFLEVSDQVLTVALREGQVQTSGSLAAPITYGGNAYLLSVWPGQFAGAQVAQNQLENLVIGGSLTPRAGGDPVMGVTGTLSELDVTLDAGLEQLAAVLPADFQPTGRLTASATVDLLAGPTYQGRLTLSPSADSVILGSSLPVAATEDLTASFSGVGGAFALSVDGAGLQVDRVPPTGNSDGRLTLMADAVDLTRFLPANATGVVDGQLSYGAAGWRGALEARLVSATEVPEPAAGADATAADQDPNLEVTARLVGAFSTLNLELTGNALAGSPGAASRVTASGPLLPSPDVTGSLRVGDDLVTGTFAWNGGVQATLRSAAQTFGGFATLPALSADVTVDPVSGAIRLTGSPAAGSGTATGADSGSASGAGTGAGAAGATDRTTDPPVAPPIDLSLQGGALSGTVALPLTLNGAVVQLDAVVTGTLSDPAVQAELTGPVSAVAGSNEGTPLAEVTGSLSSGATAVIAAPRQALAALLPASATAALGFLGDEVHAQVAVAPDGAWTAELNTQLAADLTAAGEQLTLALTAAGELGPTLHYTGELRVLTTPGPLVVASAPFSGSGAAADARLDLAEVDWRHLGAAFGVDLQIEGGGELTVTTEPFDASLSVDLTGHFAENAVSLRGSAPDDLRLSLGGPAGHLTGSLAWSDSVTGGGTALLNGELAGRPVELRLSVDDGLTSGELDLTAVGARVTAQLATRQADAAAEDGTVRHLSVSADVPVGTWAPFGGVAEAEITIDGAQAHLGSLVASIDGLLGEPHEPLNRLDLKAAGPLSSDLRVRGVVTSPRLQESLVLEVTGGSAAEPGMVATLNWRELTAAASLSDGGTITLSGRAAGTDLVSLIRAADGVLPSAMAGEVAHLSPRITDADLTWSAQSGWRGHLTAGAELPWLPTIDGVELRAEAENGNLLVVANATVPDGTARLELLAPGRDWTTAPLAGELQIDLPSSALLPSLDVPFRLQSAGSIGGTATSPTVTGTLQVGGIVTAEGTYSFVDGVGHLNAAGPELTITGRVDADGASAEARLDSLAVGPWLTQLPDGMLSLEARFSGAQVSVDSISLTTPQSSVTGRATVGLGGNGTEEARFSAALDANVDLADLHLGDVNLTGMVRGPLVVSAGSLRNLPSASVVANLAALHVGTAGLDWSVSGNLNVGGTLADPTVATQLAGDGELRGLLTATARPSAGEYAVTSTLAIGQVATDLRVDLGNGATHAAGTVRVGDGLLLVTQSGTVGAAEEAAESAATPSDLVITGAGRFAGVGAQVKGDLSAVTVTGDLSSLSEALEGKLTLSANTQGGDWLTGTLTGLSVSGYALAPLTISAVTLGATVLIESSELRATLDPGTLDWTVGVTDFGLSDGAGAPQLTLWGRGRGAAGALDASLRASDLELALEVRHDTSTTLLMEGRVYGGQLLVTAERSPASGEWNGGGRLTGSSLAGFDVTAQATVLGVGFVPTLVLSTRAANGLLLTGNASVGTDGVTLDQFVSGAPLEQMLRVQGRVLPRTDLTLSTLDLEPGTTVTVAEATRATTSSVHLTSLPGLTAEAPAGLRATGALNLGVGPGRVELAGAGTPPELAVSLSGLPRWRAEGQLLADNILDLVQEVTGNGLALQGQDDAKGLIRLDPTGPRLELDGFGLEFAGMSLEATGTLGPDAADMHGRVLVRTDLPVAERETGYVFPWTLTTDAGVWRLESEGAHGNLSVVYGAEAGAGALSLSADLQLSDGRIEGQLGLQPTGLAGILSISSVRLLSPEFGPLSIDAEATVADGRLGGSATLGSEAGQLVLNGAWGLGGLLPAAVVPDAPSGGRLEARVRALELSQLPVLAQNVPELYGQITGTAQLRDGFLFGQVVAQEIGVADLTTPMQLAFSGRPSDVTVDIQLRGAIGRANLAGGNLSGMFRFERFPLNLVSTAVVGPADFSADLTGVMRFDGPLNNLPAGYLRLATEEVRLERMGVTTLGNVTVTYDQRALLVERAEFEGLGNWRASGELRRENFDFHLEAEQADFTPLLGLVPQFARLGVGAVGSFDLSVLGNASNPSIELTSPDLRVEVSGTSYRLQNTQLDLDGVTLNVSSRVQGLAPITGTLDVNGQALLSLFPFSLSGTDLSVTGAADLSTFGRLTNIDGRLQQLPDGTPAVRVVGLMGQQPLTIEGTLAPLAIRATGTGVTARLPNLLVDHAVVDANIRLVTEPGGVALSGSVVAEEVIVDPAARRPPATATPPAESAVDPDVEPIPTVEAPPPSATAVQPRAGGLAALRFDALAIRAPGRVTLTTNVGSFEAGLDLVLGGTGAEPRLSGSASAIRGNLRFGGRDFTIDRAVATFTPNRGVYPELDVAAHAEFDKQRVVSAAPNVSFAAPREGSTFEVQLAFFGPVEPTGDGGFRFDIQPILVSNAVIEVDSQSGAGSSTRPFTEAELMALVTLGRFELNADLIGAGGLGEAVATGALDTAIDLLVVSGLESALREALGFDVVEIRTTSLSSLIEDGGQPFGVSLRVGGYLHPELFASYRIGTYDGSDPDFSITNEVLLRYGLGPLDLDVIGRIDLPAAGTQGQPRPEVGAVLGYQFSPWLGIDGGVTVSPVRSRIEFGVTIRW